MEFFKNCHTLDELKSEYRRLAKAFHPDCGGDAEVMKKVNADYERTFNAMKENHGGNTAQNNETASDFISVIDALCKLHGITVELCGSWLWISGNTKPVKEELKAAGCRWSNNKKMWYWMKGDYHKIYSGKASIEKIRSKYGSRILNSNDEGQKSNIAFIAS